MKERLQVLDSLRGLAALAVVLHHFIVVYGIKYGYGAQQYPPEWLELSIGRYGVELFFIISGFVISLTLEKGRNVTAFAISRFSRLFPTYWFCVIFTSLVLYFFREQSTINWDQFLFNLTMAPQFFWREPIDGSYWTLMYELFFYFMIAILFGKSGKITIKPLIITFIGFLFFTIFNILYPVHIKLQYISLFPHLHLFWAGIVFYKIWEYKKDVNSLNNISISTYVFIYTLMLFQWILCLFEINRVNIISSTLVSLYFLLFHLFINNKLEFLKNRILIKLGAISYSLYLIHQEVGYVIIESMYKYTHSIVISIILTTVACVLVALIINKYVETTTNRICKKQLMKLASFKGN
ncbi:acyltransferase [Colwellia sp. 1_MG-2023]|uniref:acyltransferase family protein n=1 Tax=unclassified Colwellia TaxID=196834 RepID=UPI001C0A1D75|nr:MULTISPECIES: acyltransferase [unclassified Colwellia]MBU2924938.1 acyltransferase [Colwellia sp. C2M11]MDO6652830.1 acyltransferase [Colwellia sp. 3_MG-2023]MDO6665832.1 acyltransferase [Colwellia sp. 2_MG-2023]MDO6690205.1 acyltransferase [Colwellia sp. 1_MG-2023]